MLGTGLAARDRAAGVAAGRGGRPGAAELAALVAARPYRTIRQANMETAGRGAS
jgi:hypothetical protein